MIQMRHSPRDWTRGPNKQLVRSWLICTPDTLSFIQPLPKCRFFRCKQAQLQTESQLFQNDPSANTAGFHSNGGPGVDNSWTEVDGSAGTVGGNGSETFVVVEFWFYKMKSSRNGVMAPREGDYI